MRRIWIAVLSLLFAAGGIAPGRCQAPEPAALLSRSVEALGGHDAFASIESYHATIERNIRSSADGVKYVTIEESFLAPDRVRKVASVKLAGRGGYSVPSLQVFDGAEAWSNENEKRELVQVHGGALTRAQRTNVPRFALLRAAAESRVGATFVGRSDHEGRAVERVRIDHPNARVIYDLDAETFLPVRLEIKTPDYTEVVRMSDYRPAGDLRLPFHIETETSGANEDEFMEDRFTALTVNPTLQASLFRPEGSR